VPAAWRPGIRPAARGAVARPQRGDLGVLDGAIVGGGLGLTASRVRALAADSQVGLSGALWTHRAENPLQKVRDGGHVTLSLGPATYLLVPGWAFLPLQAHNGRRCKLGVRAEVAQGSEGLRLDTDVPDWAETAEGLRSAAAATRLAEKLEEIRLLGERRVEALDRGDGAEVRRLDRTLAVLDKHI